MLTQLLTPLGFTPHLALAPVRDHPDIDTVHLFYGPPEKPDGRKALADARATVKTLGLSLVETKVKNVFDYLALLEAFDRAFQSSEGQDILFNASGGTRVMTMAGTIFCVARDVPMLYYDDYEAKGGTVVPLRAFKQLGELGETKRELLRYIAAHGPTDMTTLGAHLQLSPSTVSAHVHALLETGAIIMAREGKKQVVSMVDALQTLQMGVRA